uniref:TAFH domain-containing protein n=1 Tax=Anopheles coluzzii TaxID=1518534 RepID=A0A8W7P917_ANOCL
MPDQLRYHVRGTGTDQSICPEPTPTRKPPTYHSVPDMRPVDAVDAFISKSSLSSTRKLNVTIFTICFRLTRDAVRDTSARESYFKLLDTVLCLPPCFPSVPSHSVRHILWTPETHPESIRCGRKEQCRTPDSPEGARVVAPRSPISPQISQHHSTLVPPRSASSQVNRHGSSSPPGTVNGGGSGSSLGSLTPPPAITPASAAAVAAAAAAAAAQQDTAKLLKIRRFLGALVQFGQDANVDTGDRVRALVLSLALIIQ